MENGLHRQVGKKKTRLWPGHLVRRRKEKKPTSVPKKMQ